MDTEEYVGPEYLISQSTHTCLTVINGRSVCNAIIGMSKCHGGLNQQWFHKNGQLLWGGDQSLCLSKGKSGKLCLAPHDSQRELWIRNTQNQFILGSLALDVPWRSPRTKVHLYPKHSGSNQKWWIFSQLKALLDDSQLDGEHCLAPDMLEICKKEMHRLESEKGTSVQLKKEYGCQGEIKRFCFVFTHLSFSCIIVIHIVSFCHFCVHLKKKKKKRSFCDVEFNL